MFLSLLPVAYSEKRDHTMFFCYTHGHCFFCWLQIMCLNGKPECWKTHCTCIPGAAHSISGLTHFSWSGNMVFFFCCCAYCCLFGDVCMLCVAVLTSVRKTEWRPISHLALAPVRPWSAVVTAPLLGIFSLLNELGWLSKNGPFTKSELVSQNCLCQWFLNSGLCTDVNPW